MKNDTKDYYIREIQEKDYENGYLECLSELTEVGEISKASFIKTLSLVKEKGDYVILVAVRKDDEVVMGSGTLFIEHKFIHNLSVKGHIEDIVVCKKFRKRGIGEAIVCELRDIAKKRGCYKTALCCKEENKGFYSKCGFLPKEYEMVIYN